MLAEPPAPRQTEASPVAIARLAALLYIAITIAAPFGELYVRGKLVVKGDAAATATHILANESLYRLGGCADLLAFACDAAVALLFYALFKPAGRNASLLAAFFRLMHAVIVSVATLAYFAPLLLLQGTAYLNVFNPDQLQALALVCLRLHGQGYAIGLLFFASTARSSATSFSGRHSSRGSLAGSWRWPACAICSIASPASSRRRSRGNFFPGSCCRHCQPSWA